MSSTFERNRRSLQTDALSGFLPPSAILMAGQPEEGSFEAQEPSEDAVPSKNYARTPSGILFFASHDDLSSPGARDLLLKMIGALGMTPGNETQLEEVGNGSEFHEGAVDFGGNLVVALGEEAALAIGILDEAGVRAIVTHSLQSLIEQPQFKRESWQHLQVAAREAGWTIPQRG